MQAYGKLSECLQISTCQDVITPIIVAPGVIRSDLIDVGITQFSEDQLSPINVFWDNKDIHILAKALSVVVCIERGDQCPAFHHDHPESCLSEGQKHLPYLKAALVSVKEQCVTGLLQS